MPASPDTLPGLLERWGRERPHELAYRFRPHSGDPTEHSFGSLRERARQVASALRARVGPGDRVLLLEPPGLRFLELFFGIMGAGAVAVPLAPPRAPRNLSRVAAAARVSRARWAVGPHADALSDLGVEAWIPSNPSSDPALALEADPAGLAFLQFTSGSTGTPRGVALGHRQVLHNLGQISEAFAFDDETVVAGWLPLQHDMGLIGNVLGPMFVGRPCHLMPPESFLMRPGKWLSMVSEVGATVSGGPDFAWAHCVEHVRERELTNFDFSSWRVAFSGAEPVRPSTLGRFVERFASVGFRRSAFLPCYGLAEATLLVASGSVTRDPQVARFDAEALASGRLKEESPESQRALRALVGHGGPHGGQQISIVGAEGHPCREGEIGEIWVAGESVAGAYFEDDPATDATFGAGLAVEPGPGRYLRTGDLGAWWRGELYVTGRTKDLIIVGGKNVYPQDVEAWVVSSHPDLRASAVFGMEIDDVERVVAVAEVERRALRHLDVAEIGRRARETLFREEGLALHDLVLLRPGAIPRTTSGKVQRRACRSAYESGGFHGLEGGSK